MILDIILFCIIAALGLLYYRQDSIIKAQIEYIEEIEDNHIKKYNIITEAYKKMQDLDSNGGFESDDEVGEIFKSIRDLIVELEKEIASDRE